MKTIEHYGNDSMNQDVIDPTKDTLPALSSKVMFWRPKYLNESHWLEYVPFYFWLAEALKPELIVDSKVGEGVTYFSLCQAVDKLNLDTICHGFNEGKAVDSQVKGYNFDNYREFSEINGEVFNEGIDQYPDGSIDLFIMKNSELLLKDLKMMEKLKLKLSSKSVVLIHGSQNKDVRQICQNLKNTYESFEFSYGEGLLVVGFGELPEAKVSSFLQQSKSMPSSRLVQNIYSRLGESCKESWLNRKLTQELESLSNDIRGYKHAAESAERDNSRLIAELNESIINLEESVEKLKKEEKTNRKLSDDLAGRSTLLNSLKTELDGLKEAKAEVEKEKTEVEKRNQDLNRSVDTRFKELAELTIVAKDTDEELQKAKSDKSTILSKLQVSEEENKNLYDAQIQLKTSLKVLADRAKSLELDRDSLKGELSVSNQKIAQLSEESSRNQLLSKENENLKHELELADNKMAELANGTVQMQALADENKKLKKNNELLESDQGAAARIIADQKKEIINLEQSLQKRFDELAVLTRMLNESQAVESEAESNTTKSDTKSKSGSAAFPIVSKISKRRKKKIKEQKRLIDNIRKIEESGLFDETWYLNQYPEAKRYKKGPAAHYLLIGFSLGLDPSSKFSTNYYYAAHQDVEEAGMNPLLHYIDFGISEGREFSKV
jgi:myosin heavy subunit